ncbi:MAG: polysaccharide deacetylase family protein [Pseudomonadota bacterium]
MADLGYLSQKIGGAIDKILCENFDKRRRTLPAGKYVSLCFDDFPQSAARLAAPMIEKRNWRATWYIAGAFEGTVTAEYGRMFDAEDLRKLRQNGHDFGCHTYDHIDCRHASAEEIAAQAARSKAYLAAHGIEEIRSFAFPFGSVDLPTKRLMSQAGPALRGVKPGLNRGTIDLNMLKACGLQDNQDGTAKAMQDLQTLETQDGWLIIFTHDVRERPSPWGVKPAAYAQLLSAVEHSGAEVITVGDMVDRLNAASSPLQEAA